MMLHLSFRGLYPGEGSMLEAHVHILSFKLEQLQRFDSLLEAVESTALAGKYALQIEDAIARDLISRIARLVSITLSEEAHIDVTTAE